MAKQSLPSYTRAIFLCLTTLALTGCGAAAAPCRVGSAALKIIPWIGHDAATPTDWCANEIDPSSPEP